QLVRIADGGAVFGLEEGAGAAINHEPRSGARREVEAGVGALLEGVVGIAGMHRIAGDGRDAGGRAVSDTGRSTGAVTVPVAGGDRTVGYSNQAARIGIVSGSNRAGGIDITNRTLTVSDQTADIVCAADCAGSVGLGKRGAAAGELSNPTTD